MAGRPTATVEASRTATATGRPPRRSPSWGWSSRAAADNGGARISSVREDSPAADAELESGDVVTKIDDTTVADDDDLIRAIRARDPGDDVTVTYTRDGNTANARSRSAIVRWRPAVPSPSHPDRRAPGIRRRDPRAASR